MKLKLSDAIGLGRMLIKHGDGSSTLYNCEGCAVGMALAAVGETFGFSGTLQKHWPWADCYVWHEISKRYFRVVYGFMTLDELIDYVRSIEPQEPEQIETTIEEPEVVEVSGAKI